MSRQTPRVLHRLLYRYPIDYMAMKLLVDPPTLPRQAAGTNPNFPKNLEEARSRIAFLNQEIARLKAAAVTPLAKTNSTAPTPTAKPKLAGSGADSPTYPATGPLPTPGHGSISLDAYADSRAGTKGLP
jgi:hypothetical protein